MNRFILLTFAFLSLSSLPAFAGNCDYSWQTASDGSHCGGRAADMRPGGTLSPYNPTR